jgi:hypothetical protein
MQLCTECPGCRVLVLTAHENRSAAHAEEQEISFIITPDVLMAPHNSGVKVRGHRRLITS